jgi:hypothetical protein
MISPASPRLTLEAAPEWLLIRVDHSLSRWARSTSSSNGGPRAGAFVASQARHRYPGEGRPSSSRARPDGLPQCGTTVRLPRHPGRTAPAPRMFGREGAAVRRPRPCPQRPQAAAPFRGPRPVAGSPEYGESRRLDPGWGGSQSCSCPLARRGLRTCARPRHARRSRRIARVFRGHLVDLDPQRIQVEHEPRARPGARRLQRLVRRQWVGSLKAPPHHDPHPNRRPTAAPGSVFAGAGAPATLRTVCLCSTPGSDPSTPRATPSRRDTPGR